MAAAQPFGGNGWQIKQANQYNMKKAFSPVSRWRSIRYAIEGVRTFFINEPNAVLHLLSTVLVFVLSFLFPVTRNEAFILVLATGSVWAAELFNTAIEKTIDFISPERHPSIKFIKDVSAAAVLVTAFTALITGLVIFIPKIFSL